MFFFENFNARPTEIYSNSLIQPLGNATIIFLPALKEHATYFYFSLINLIWYKMMMERYREKDKERFRERETERETERGRERERETESGEREREKEL